jgi:hypothetical protein
MKSPFPADFLQGGIGRHGAQRLFPGCQGILGAAHRRGARIELADRIEIAFHRLPGHWFNQQDGSIPGHGLPGMLDGILRVTHVMKAIEKRDQIIIGSSGNAREEKAF